MTALGTLLLAGCSWVPGFVHRQEGGEIAKPLPPPPGENRPYPNLASVPARPAPPNQAELQRLSQSLIADRENASHELMPSPPDPSLPSTSPALFGVGTAPPPPPPAQTASNAASANLAAASAPPQAAAPATQAAPPKKATAANLPAPTAPPTATAPAISPGPPAPPTITSMNPQPGPGSTPFPAADYGGSPPGAATAAHSPAQPPFGAVASPASPTGIAPLPPASRSRLPTSPAGPPLPANPATTVVVNFPAGSAVLPADAAGALHALAAKRGQHRIAVTGHGDANGLAPQAQSEAVALGLQRAQSIAQALAADGVPDNAISIDSEATGRGGAARIVE